MVTALTFVGVCVLGHFVVASSMYGMRWLALKERQPREFWGSWSVFLIGVTERYAAC